VEAAQNLELVRLCKVAGEEIPMKIRESLLLPFLSLFAGIVFAADVADIKPEALLDRAKKADESFVILDVRTPEEFAEGHVPGAINIPHDKLDARIAELMGDRSKDVVLYCRSGRRAALAADTLKASGFTKLLHLDGDMQQWTEAKRPTEK
jgi:rhodanese-related sulfurtransferase